MSYYKLYFTDHYLPPLQDGDGNTALHLAAKAGSVECSELLLRAENVRANVLNRKGFTAAYLAAISKHKNDELMLAFIRYRVHLFSVKSKVIHKVANVATFTLDRIHNFSAFWTLSDDIDEDFINRVLFFIDLNRTTRNGTRFVFSKGTFGV